MNINTYCADKWRPHQYSHYMLLFVIKLLAFLFNLIEKGSTNNDVHNFTTNSMMHVDLLSSMHNNENTLVRLNKTINSRRLTDHNGIIKLTAQLRNEQKKRRKINNKSQQ